jgi:N-acyl-D-amino-acid deacylase
MPLPRPFPALALVLALALPGCHLEERSADDSPADAGEASSVGLAADPAEGFEGAAIRAYDWLIAGGQVLDGSGESPRRADVLVADGLVAHVGIVDPDTLEVRERFDATGLVVTPGFIDAHAHGNPVDDPGFPNFLAMGVTTIVLGQDGSGPEAGTLDGHLDQVDRARPAVNVAYLVGHNTVRRESGVGFAPPSPEGSARMAELVARGLAAGAFGLSTGLEYDPGNRADAEELAAVAQPVAEHGGVVMSHLRNEDADAVESSVAELLEQGRRSGARVHVSHLKVVLGSDTAQARRILGMLAEARETSIRATADLYPYTASFTGLAILFPEWARPPNDYDEVVRQRRDELAGHLRARVEARNGPEATLFGTGELRGRTLAEVARDRGRPFEEVLVDLGPGGARAAYFVMDEGVMTTFLRDPWVAVASDGSPAMAHPRGYGTFPRVIRRYVVEENVLSPEEAVRRMSGLPASILGLDDPARVTVPRGLIREGWAADLASFDPADLRDRAEYEDPHQTAVGMRGVWVSGELAWRDDAPLPGPGHGRALRARRADTAPEG